MNYFGQNNEVRIIDTESVINASPCMISNLFLGS